MNTIEEVKVYSDLLDKSENKFLNEFLKGFKEIEPFENKNNIVDTYSSTKMPFSKYVSDYKLPLYNQVEDKKPAIQIEQEWEGYVQEIDDKNGIFTALLLDITLDEKYPTEEADFKQESIHKFERHFLREGAVFRWIIGCEHSNSGMKRVSQLSFRRMPVWNKYSLNRAKKEAQQFKDEIIWE